MIRSVRELPPGSITIFTVDVDEFGNETYVGGPVTYGGFNVPSDGISDGGDVVGGPIPPSYATPPVPRNTTPPDSEWEKPPGGRNLDQEVRDGLSCAEAGRRSIVAVPSIIEGAGWQDPGYVLHSDDNYATTEAPPDEYSDTISLSNFDLSGLPLDAQITGIKVTVERNIILTTETPPPPPPQPTIDKPEARTGSTIYAIGGTGSYARVQKFDRATMAFLSTLTLTNQTPTIGPISPDYRNGAPAVGQGQLYYLTNAEDLVRVDLSNGFAYHLGFLWEDQPAGLEMRQTTTKIFDENKDTFLITCHSYWGDGIGIKRVDKATGSVLHEATHYFANYRTISQDAVMFPMDDKWYIGGGDGDLPAVGFSNDLSVLYQNMTDFVCPESFDNFINRGYFHGWSNEAGGKVKVYACKYNSIRTITFDFVGGNVVVDTPLVEAFDPSTYAPTYDWNDPSLTGLIYDGTDLFLFNQYGYISPAQSLMAKINKDTFAMVADQGNDGSNWYDNYAFTMDWE